MRRWLFLRALRQRCQYVRKDHILIRKSDGTMWAAGSPQDMGLAMAALQARDKNKLEFHFYKVRIWRGVPIVSKKVFWIFGGVGKFTFSDDVLQYTLPPLNYDVECRKVRAAMKAHKYGLL